MHDAKALAVAMRPFEVVHSAPHILGTDIGAGANQYRDLFEKCQQVVAASHQTNTVRKSVVVVAGPAPVTGVCEASHLCAEGIPFPF
jgi:hypothetical protein